MVAIVNRAVGRVLHRIAASAFATQFKARTMARVAPSDRVASHLTARSVLRYVRPDTTVTRTTARNLLRITPDFRWIDMFSDKVFPNDISQNSDAATRFNTQVNQVASGHDQRIALWDYPLMEYNVAYGVRTMEDLHDLIRFFRVMRGKLNAFRFLDNIDHQSNFAIYDESREPDPVEPTDQLIGVGDDLNIYFQLVKHYDFEDETSSRPIYKPIPDTVIVAVDGNEIEHFTCDHSTGIVTINSRVSRTVPNARLDKISQFVYRISAPGYSAGPPAVGIALPIFMEGEWLTATGFAAKEFVRAIVVSSTPTQVEFTVPGDAIAIGQVQSGVNLQIRSDNTPRIGEQVTAGFHFHVPVRFDTDRIPVKLEYYGIGSASEIKLVEVRPDEEDA